MKRTVAGLSGCWLLLAVAPGWATEAAGVSAFIQANCADCHDSETKEAGLDLTALEFAPASPENFGLWVKVHDRVQKGEMPPADSERPQPEELDGFLQFVSASLLTADRERVAAEGRATRRRLNRFEYENTLRDLLSLPALEVRDFLPEDSLASGSNKVGQALDVSHVQMARYLKAADFALRQAMVPVAERPETTVTRYHAWDQRGLFAGAGPTIRKTFPLLGLEMKEPPRRRRRGSEPAQPQPEPTPEEREQQSIAIVVSTYEPTEIQFNGFRAPVTARYRLRFSAFTIWMSPDFQTVTPGRRPEPLSIYSDRTPAIYRKLGGFDVGPGPTVRELEAWLGASETIRPDAARLVRSRPPDFKNPLAEPDGMPGVSFQWMEVEGPLYDEWPPAGHQLLFGDLPMKNKERPPQEEPTGFRRRATPPPPPGVEIISSDPHADAERLLRRFMEQAYRRPVQEADVQRFLRVITSALESGHSFADAMIAGYTAVLCSPAFLYLEEQPGRLDALALANRLSYFLWNTRPDEELYGLATAGELLRPEVLRQQTDRLLDDPRSRQFVDAFLDYWLDLRLIVATSPDVSLYPDYDLDDLLVESSVEETQLFFRELALQDLGVANLLDSDFTFLNERLATHYGIAGVEGVDMRRLSLPEDSVRGGLMTQASALKVTANGTTTSPVKRGVWVMDRLLGKPPPPPPEKVPEVKPDVRGATTIREQLAKHREIESCNQCHQHIDPAGMALESFDVLGAWRERYRSLGEGEPQTGVGHNGLRFQFRLGPGVEPAAELADGRKFQNVEQLKQCLLQDQEQVARNLVQRLTVYATGAPIRFSDRPVIAEILARGQTSGYGVRTLIHEIVQSEMFLNK